MFFTIVRILHKNGIRNNYAGSKQLCHQKDYQKIGFHATIDRPQPGETTWVPSLNNITDVIIQLPINVKQQLKIVVF